jgi:membrane-associated phospholipid phosphatase
MTNRTWSEEIGRRLAADWWIKLPGVLVFMLTFFTAYFALLKHPSSAVTIMPLTAIDAWIELRPGALWLYLSLWVYVPLAAGMSADRTVLLRHALVATGCAVIGLALFYFWPTAVPVSLADWSKYPLLAPLKSTDAAGNACPSLHVAFAIVAAVALENALREVAAPRGLRGLNVLWCVGILYSTIAIRQHVFVDVVGGTALGIAGAFFLRSDFAGQVGRLFHGEAS